jgi:hypothetical protein
MVLVGTIERDGIIEEGEDVYEGGRREKTYLNMHLRFPRYMQSNLGKRLHILKSR